MGSASVASSETKKYSLLLLLLGMLSAGGYIGLSALSSQFAPGVPDSEKPTIVMLAIFAFEFVCYWIAIGLIARLPPTKRLLWGIICGACVFRAILLPSVPMHEIDIYRYNWDGAVLAKGISPYRYSPQQVRNAAQQASSIQDPDLHALVLLRGQSESLAFSLDQIHYGELSSPYPPVSQAVFALVALVTPDSVSPHVRVVIMKLLLVLFDLATLLVVIALLREVGLHPGISIVYGWCPLVLKEIANGGHLDSIAIFFTSLAILLLVRCGNNRTDKPILAVTLSGAVLALAIGAKLYPVVLLPLFVAVWWRRAGIQTVAMGMLAAVIPSVILLWPLMSVVFQNTPIVAEQTQIEDGLVAEDSNPESSQKSHAGLQAFFKHWEMNDLLFIVVLENLRPQADVATEVRPWFVVMPDSWSKATVGVWMSLWDRNESILGTEANQSTNDASFLLARMITFCGFSIVAGLLAWRAASEDHPQAWCRAAMLTLAWFWLTCPTQNPWYWCWIVPLLPFAKYRTWHLVAGCSMLYYLRFWLIAHFPDPPLLGTNYNGKYFFFYVVVWVEYFPFFLLLGFEWLQLRRSRLLATDTQRNKISKEPTM